MYIRRLLPLLALVALVGCGASHQDFRVESELDRVPPSSRFAALPVSVAPGVTVDRDQRNDFDTAFVSELSKRGLLGGSVGARLKLQPVISGVSISGGVENAFLASSGEAVVNVELRVVDSGGEQLGVIKSTQVTDIAGLLPKVMGPDLMRSAAISLVDELAARARRSGDEDLF